MSFSAYGRARTYCPGFNSAGAVTLATLGKCGGTGIYNGKTITIKPGSITAYVGGPRAGGRTNHPSLNSNTAASAGGSYTVRSTAKSGNVARPAGSGRIPSAK